MNTIQVDEEKQIHEPTLIDKIEASMVATMRMIELPLKHIFTPGLYQRIIHIPARTLLTSRVHNYRQPFVISQGCIQVINELTGERKTYKAPYHGITEPGTRRALFAVTDTIWATFHVTDLTDPDEIVEAVSCKHPNPLTEGIIL